MAATRNRPTGTKIEMPDDFKAHDASGLTADELAAMYGVSVKTIRRWRGKTRPTYLSRMPGEYRGPGRTQR